MSSCRRFHPGKRITVEEALAHPYLASLHDPSDEPLAHAEFSFDFERMPLTKNVLRDLLTAEMCWQALEVVEPTGLVAMLTLSRFLSSRAVGFSRCVSASSFHPDFLNEQTAAAPPPQPQADAGSESMQE